jgi:GntR family transcriptional repressor for pyruvate dehydrogenase complex
MGSPIRRISTPEVIVDYILKSIDRGDLRPGRRLPSERKLQDELGVGRLALREALARLSALGVIRVEHGRGAFLQERVCGETISQALTPLLARRSTKSLQDLVQARSLIEGEVTALAAVRRTKADVRRLEAMLDRPDVDPGDETALAELDYAFHQEVARIADNEFLAVMLGALADQIRQFLLRYVRAYRDPTGIIERHRPIVDAIIAGDSSRARDCAREHVNICKTSIEACANRGRSQSDTN